MRSRFGRREAEALTKAASARPRRTTQRKLRFAAGRDHRQHDEVGAGDDGAFLESATGSRQHAVLPLSDGGSTAR